MVGQVKFRCVIILCGASQRIEHLCVCIHLVLRSVKKSFDKKIIILDSASFYGGLFVIIRHLGTTICG